MGEIDGFRDGVVGGTLKSGLHFDMPFRADVMGGDVEPLDSVRYAVYILYTP